MSAVAYSANNSGGSWWLTDDHWRALEAAGWIVEWEAQKNDRFLPARPDANGNIRWLGALARGATINGVTMAEAIASWEKATGLTSTSLGCGCCGPPHSFKSGSEYWSPDSPEHGERYEADA